MIFEPNWGLWPGKQILKKFWELFYLLEVLSTVIYIFETMGCTLEWQNKYFTENSPKMCSPGKACAKPAARCHDNVQIWERILFFWEVTLLSSKERKKKKDDVYFEHALPSSGALVNVWCRCALHITEGRRRPKQTHQKDLMFDFLPCLKI